MTKALKILRDYVERAARQMPQTQDSSYGQEAIKALDELDDHIDWLDKGIDEWRSLAQNNSQMAMRMAFTLRIALSHLHATLNQQHNANDQLKADTAARDWLISIGSEPSP